MINTNPYIGPRTFRKEESHLFFGRDREARDLTALVVSERLVLFYAQSGTGKSSLINTRLIPDLENNHFEVLPIGRLTGEALSSREFNNIYVYNLIQGLIQHQLDRNTLADLSLSQFLHGLDADEQGYFYNRNLSADATGNGQSMSWRRALIIDQFEELFSNYPEAWEKREDFFRQLADAMEIDSHLWVVLVMREDYIAAVDPYVHLLPGSLRMRYYLQRLERKAALRAIQGPVEEVRPYAEGVADTLVENLASIQVQRHGGIQEIQLGQYVEPVHLQVVCYSLWEHLSPAGSQITEKDLQAMGDVNQSLERFYDERVNAVAGENGIPERLIREWFDEELITGSGNRNLVPFDSSNHYGLEDQVLQALQRGLIRAEMRAGQIWYEISHDRLVESIRRSNKAWFEKNLSLFQRQAVLWMQQGHSEGLLLRGTELENAEREAKTLPLTATEQNYLEASRNLRKRSQRDQIQQRVIIAALVISIMLLAAAVYFGVASSRATREAKEQASIASTAEAKAIAEQKDAENANATAQVSEENAKQQAENALAGSLAAQADAIKAQDHGLALLLGMEAYKREDNLLTRTTLFELLQFSPFTRLFGYRGPVTGVAISPDGTLIASASCAEYQNNKCARGEIILVNAVTHQPVVEISGDFGNVNSLAFNNDGTILAAAGCVPVNNQNEGCTENRGQITLWNVANPTEPISDTREGHVGLVKSIAFHPNGNILASGSFDKRVILWDVSDPADPGFVSAPLLGHTSFVNGLAFSPDGKTLVSAGDDRNILLWDVSKPATAHQIGTAIEVHTAPVNSIAFSQDGRKFASASSDHTVLLWDWGGNGLQHPIRLEGHIGYATSVSFSADGSILASAGFDNRVILWDTSTGQQIGPPLSEHSRAINDVAFGSLRNSDGFEDPYLVSSSNDHTIIQWNLSTRQPLSQPMEATSSPIDVTRFARRGSIEATVDELQIKIEGENGEARTLLGHTGVINNLAFSPGEITGKILLVSASNDQTVIVWDVSDVLTADVFLKLEGFENPVLSAFFDEDGRLITIEDDGHTIRWTIDPTDWNILACEAVDGNLTESQWSQYLPNQEPRETCEAKP